MLLGKDISYVRENRIETARILLNAGADAGNADQNGQTPLYYSVKMGHLEMSELLIDNGCNVDHLDNKNE